MALINMEVAPNTARNILRDLYTPCIDSLESWDPCVRYTSINELSDDECIEYLQYVLAGYTLNVSFDESTDTFHPSIKQ